MFAFRPLPPGVRSRKRAVSEPYSSATAPRERRKAGRWRLLRKWLSPGQREQFAKKGYFEVVGSDSGRRYRIHAGALVNVCEIDEKGCRRGLCFMPIGALPIGDVMLAQKIALETCEREVRTVARRFTPNGFHFRQIRPLG